MDIGEMKACSDEEFGQIAQLLGELSPGCVAHRDMIDETISGEASHLFVARTPEGIIAGMATVCCFSITTGRHATIEDVVVLPEYQGQGLGRKLVQATLDFLRHTGKSYKVGLTSKPARVAANALYRSMGFRQKETNVYVLDIN